MNCQCVICHLPSMAGLFTVGIDNFNGFTKLVVV